MPYESKKWNYCLVGRFGDAPNNNLFTIYFDYLNSNWTVWQKFALAKHNKDQAHSDFCTWSLRNKDFRHANFRDNPNPPTKKVKDKYEMLQKKYDECMKETDDEENVLKSATMELEKVIGKKLSKNRGW